MPSTAFAVPSAASSLPSAVAAPMGNPYVEHIAAAAATSRTIVRPLADQAQAVQDRDDVSSETHHLLRAQELLRHAIPDGDVGVIVARALTLLVRTVATPRMTHLKFARR
ncbi:MAG: hypothetical protein ABI818_04610 [Acidobacteriota bacterium]